MKCYFKFNILALLVLASTIYLPNSRATAQTQAKPAGAQPAAQEADSNTTEEEWNAFDAATKEPDYEKRGTTLLDFMKKYPKSEYMKNIEYEYETNLLGLCEKEEKWALLKSLSEKWLTLHPGSLKMHDFIARASLKTGDYKRGAESLEEIYAKQPTGTLARLILETYEKANNLTKQIDWTDKILKMQGFEGEFILPFDIVKKYTSANNLPKAIEYCKKTLVAADAAKQPDAKTQEQLVEIRNGCHLLIGKSLYDADKFADAEKEYQQALKYKKSSDAYFHIGMCMWNQKKQELVDNALLHLAAAVLIGEDPYKASAKKGLEELYKSQHNQSIETIDKEYKKAKEQLLSK
jgi:tetratricopeptide (TPR) repeat protein